MSAIKDGPDDGPDRCALAYRRIGSGEGGQLCVTIGSIMTTTSAAILLFFVMDPLGNIPLFLTALKPVDPSRRLWVVGRELLIAYVLLVAFLFAGRPLLVLLGISEPALTIAGGVVLFLIEPGRQTDWCVAVSTAWLASAVILLAGAKLSNFFGEKGLTAIERVMGMVLVASAVQMFLDGAEKIPFLQKG